MSIFFHPDETSGNQFCEIENRAFGYLLPSFLRPLQSPAPFSATSTVIRACLHRIVTSVPKTPICPHLHHTRDAPESGERSVRAESVSGDDDAAIELDAQNGSALRRRILSPLPTR